MVVLGLTFLTAWVAVQICLPFALPLLLGWAMAALVQPQVGFLHRRLHLPRGLSSAVCVTAGLGLLGICVVIAGSGLYREAAVLARGLPEAVRQFSRKASELRLWALERVKLAPAGLEAPLERMVGDLFNSGSVLLEQGTSVLLSLAGSVVGGLSGGALLAGTAVVSSYMISAQYPALRRRFAQSRLWRERGILVRDHVAGDHRRPRQQRSPGEAAHHAARHGKQHRGGPFQQNAAAVKQIPHHLLQRSLQSRRRQFHPLQRPQPQLGRLPGELPGSLRKPRASTAASR